MDLNRSGKFIAEMRKEKGLTQKELADRLFVSDKAVSRWETGRGFPEVAVIEELCAELGISPAELFKGERIAEELSSTELDGFTVDLLGYFKGLLKSRRISYFVTGMLCALIVLLTVFVHLNSPIYFNDPEGIVKLETLNDGRNVLILDESVSGYELEMVENDLFLTCYRDLIYQLEKKEAKFILVDDVDSIYYYPCAEGDKLIYSKNGPKDGGVITLPRLVYNYWALIGIVFSIVGIAAAYLSHNKYYGATVRKIALIPLSFTVSLFIVLSGRFDQIYNAAYYLSDIILLGICVYLLLYKLLNKLK